MRGRQEDARHEPGHQCLVEGALMSSAEQFDHIFATGLAIGAKRDEQFLKQRVRGVVHLLGKN